MIDGAGRGRGGMMGESVRWSDEAGEVISGDITAAVACLNPAGGAVATAVAPGLGNRQRDAGLAGFTTSVGFGRKLDRPAGRIGGLPHGYWQVVADGGAIYAPHTSTGFIAPPQESAAGLGRDACQGRRVASPPQRRSRAVAAAGRNERNLSRAPGRAWSRSKASW